MKSHTRYKYKDIQLPQLRSFCLVATVPEFRGRGLCSELMRPALRSARETDGCTTTTLEGSPMGEPVYDRMGYRSLGRFGLWEKRQSNNSA